MGIRQRIGMHTERKRSNKPKTCESYDVYTPRALGTGDVDYETETNTISTKQKTINSELISTLLGIAYKER